jgi:hypothetical protein
MMPSSVKHCCSLLSSAIKSFQHRDKLIHLFSRSSSSSHRSPIRPKLQQEDLEESDITTKEKTQVIRESSNIGEDDIREDRAKQILERPCLKEFHEIPGPSPSLPLIGTNWIYFKFGEILVSMLNSMSQ